MGLAPTISIETFSRFSLNPQGPSRKMHNLKWEDSEVSEKLPMHNLTRYTVSCLYVAQSLELNSYQMSSHVEQPFYTSLCGDDVVFKVSMRLHGAYSNLAFHHSGGLMTSQEVNAHVETQKHKLPKTQGISPDEQGFVHIEVPVTLEKEHRKQGLRLLWDLYAYDSASQKMYERLEVLLTLDFGECLFCAYTFVVLRACHSKSAL